MRDRDLIDESPMQGRFEEKHCRPRHIALVGRDRSMCEATSVRRCYYSVLLSTNYHITEEFLPPAIQKSAT